jgi:hypothetical protein
MKCGALWCHHWRLTCSTGVHRIVECQFIGHTSAAMEHPAGLPDLHERLPMYQLTCLIKWTAWGIEWPLHRQLGATYCEWPCGVFHRQWLDTRLQSGWQPCFVIGRYRVQISNQVPAILSEDFRGIFRSVQTNSLIVLFISPWPFPSISLLILYLVFILPLDAVQSEILTSLLSKLQMN